MNVTCYLVAQDLVCLEPRDVAPVFTTTITLLSCNGRPGLCYLASQVALIQYSPYDTHFDDPGVKVWDEVPKNSNLQKLVSPVDRVLLDEYVTLGSTVVADIVLPPPENATNKARRRFARVFISLIYRTSLFVSAAFQAHTAEDSSKPSVAMRDVLNFLNHVTLRPPTALTLGYLCEPRQYHLLKLCGNSYSLDFRKGKWLSRTTWIRANLCAYFHPHLTDEANLYAGIVGVVRAIVARALPEGAGTIYIYGVLNSVTHCALVSYDVKSRTIRHTYALPLIPPWVPQGFSELKPGMAALTSLCQHLDSADDGLQDFPAPKRVKGCRLPFDVLSHVADLIEDTGTLLCFAAAASVCKQAAK